MLLLLQLVHIRELLLLGRLLLIILIIRNIVLIASVRGIRVLATIILGVLSAVVGCSGRS